MAHDPMTPQFCRITKKNQETEDVFTLEISPNRLCSKATFKPGQFNMLYAFGIGEVAISISGDPEKKKSWIHTVRAVGASTKALSKLKVGDLIGLRGPYGTYWPIAEQKGKDILFIAGGLGLAPLRPAIYHVLRHRKNFKKVSLLYGSRSYNDFLFKKEIQDWKKGGIETHVSMSQADRKWKGSVGHVTTLIERIDFIPGEMRAFLCGPEIMMRFGATELQKRGMTEDQIFLSMERNMKCAIGFCGHCQLQSTFICKDGPVFPYSRMEPYLRVREL